MVADTDTPTTEDKVEAELDEDDPQADRDERAGRKVARTEDEAEDQKTEAKAAKAAAKPATTARAGVAPERDSAGNLPASASLQSTFLKLSGYKEADVIGSNEDRRSFVTANGGKYAISKSGKSLRTIQGPPTPKERKAAEEAVEEEE